jgi:outer membrane protein TolC
MTNDNLEELLGTGSWKRAAAVAGAVLLALAVATVENAHGQQVTGRPPAVSLPEAVRTAIRQNRDVEAARLGLREANERVSEAWGSVYPSLDFNASYTRNVTPNVSFLPAAIFGIPDAGPDDYIAVQFSADNQWSSTISLEQPIFEAAAFIGVGAAGRYKNLQEEVVRGVTQDVVTRVRVSYYDLLLQQEQQRLTANSVRRVRESLKETRAMNKAGLTSDYDVLRLEVELANLEPNLRRAENGVRQAQRQLVLELDLPEDAPLTVQGSLAEMNLDDPSQNSPANQEVLGFTGFGAVHVEEVDRAMRMAADLRSDLRQLELTESLRKTEMRLQQAEYLPRVSFFGTYQITAQDNGSPNFFGRGDGQRAYGRQVGISVSVPLFGGFSGDARVDQRRAVLRQAETQSRLASNQARVQVQNLVEQADEALMRARGQRLAVTQAQRGYEIASAQYGEGLSSQLELTDAEVALRQSEFNYAQAVYDYLVARARLDEATGQVPMVDTGERVANGF